MPITKDIFFILIAFAAGMAMAVQGSMNSAVSRAIGLSQATFVVHFSATAIMTAILLSGISRGDWSNYSRIPWYYYLGGLIGVIITYAVVLSIPKLGAAMATTAIIVGQVLTACIVDHFGFFGLDEMPFTWLKFLGLILLSLGAKLLLN